MPIVKYIAIRSTPLSNIKYILKGEKNDEMKYATGLNCTADPQCAYDEFKDTFENFAKVKFFEQSNNNSDSKKSKIRIHHYVQSFDPKENITPEEAHKIGIEWANRFFGENMKVIISTHIDKNHIHNHFAVCPYSLDGKHWNANLKSLSIGRKISDQIALEHGLRIISNPKHKNTLKYNEWLAKQLGTSWKQKLCNEIDKLVLKGDVQTLEDLINELKEQGYTIKKGKYLSIKAPKQKNAVRSYRLGDGYALDELQYRIEHKENEISDIELQKYSGVQRKCALIIKEMQIKVFRYKSKETSYQDLLKSADMLNYLCSNNITSLDELESRLNEAAEKFQSVISEKKKLSEQIATVDKVVSDGKSYLELVNKEFLSADEKKVFQNVLYVNKHGINDIEDITERERHLLDLKSHYSNLENLSETLYSERKHLTNIYEFLKRDVAYDPFGSAKSQLEEIQNEQNEQVIKNQQYYTKGER